MEGVGLEWVEPVDIGIFKYYSIVLFYFTYTESKWNCHLLFQAEMIKTILALASLYKIQI